MQALEFEQKQEEEYFRQVSFERSYKERIESGVLWYPVSIDKVHFTIAEKIEIEMTPGSMKAATDRNSFKEGSSAVFFINREEREEYRGTISFANRRRVRIIINSERIVKDDIINLGNCGVELIYDGRPYQVMRESLTSLLESREVHISSIREGVETGVLHQQAIPEHRVIHDHGHLNSSQIEAINGCLKAELMGIIHGPPGTGKTTTLVQLIKSITRYENKILVCASSNNAVDLLARKISEEGISVVRIGNVTRIGDNIGHLCLEERVRDHKDWQHIKQVKIEAEAAKKEASRYKRKFGPQQKRDRIAFQREARELRKWARELEERLVEDVIQSSQVICTTLIGSAHSHLEGRTFQTVIIDEASQALEAESWTAILKGRKVILAGDHKQLPPTVKSAKALALGFNETILDRLTNKIKETYLLDTQYRMNQEILSFSNHEFYEGALRSADFVRNRRLHGDSSPLLFIDTSGCGFDEKRNHKDKSYSNSEEFYVIREHLLQNAQLFAQDVSIGIISPYSGQVSRIREEIQKDDTIRIFNIDVNSIDGFQGQEKDVIYISLVRSNDEGNIGFLKDYRRLNVALTRAKMKLIIVGDMSTLGADEVYLRLSEHIDKVGTYQSAWEYMS